MTRKPLPDLLKGLAVVFMIQVHLMELFATEELFLSWAGRISLFLGGPFAAPVFMAVMGYFLAASNRSTSSRIARGLRLVALGLLLNIGLNLHFLLRTGLTAETWQYIFGVDILLMAGLSIIIITLLSLLAGDRYYVYLIFALLIALLADLLRDLPAGPVWAKYLTAFFRGSTSWSYFPLFPWMAYPLLGYGYYFFGRKNKIIRETFKRKKNLLFAVSAILVVASLPFALRVSADLPRYYHHGALFFLWMIIFLSFWAWTLQYLQDVSGGTRIGAFLKWLGRNVTAVYFVQWLIIGNLAPVFYKTQFLLPLTGWFLLVLSLTSAIVYCWNISLHGKINT